MRTSLMMVIALTVALFAVVPAVAIPRIERDLATRAADTLRREGLGWASIAAAGRTLRIEGEAPTQRQRDQALALALGVNGAVDVVDATSVAPIRDYAIQAVRTPEVLTVSGSVPDQATADAVLAAISAVDPALRVESAIEVVPGEADPGWRDAAVTAGDRAARLLEGTVALSRDGLVVTGSVLDADALALIEAAPSAAGSPALSVDVAVLTPRLYELSLSRRDDHLVIAGEAPDALSRDALVALAERQGVPLVDSDGLTIVTGVASDDWHMLSSALVRHIGAMQQAEARLEPGRVTLDGVIADPQIAEITRTALASVVRQQQGMALDIDIRTPDAAGDVTAGPVIADTAELLTWADVADVPELGEGPQVGASDCQSALNALLADSQIPFVGDGPDLDPAGRSLLEAVALTIRRCPEADVEVSGHTERTDAPATSEAISAARAEAVVDYLVRRGVDESRLVAAGYGDAVPVADNATAEGRQRNRRIEFLVVPRQ